MWCYYLIVLWVGEFFIPGMIPSPGGDRVGEGFTLHKKNGSIAKE